MAGSEEPLVSVVCATFNHANYISYCLEGILAQETDFPFEILIHDDASTDGTSAIVKAYADQYPGLIKATIQTENQFSRGRKPRTILADQARGQFIAICDGDDRWTDPHKLRHQVRFLREHPEHALSYHRSSRIDADNQVFQESDLPEWKDYSRRQLRSAEHGKLPLATMVYRNIKLDIPWEIRRVLLAELFLPFLLGRFGSAGFQAEIGPSHIRVHAASLWTSKSTLSRLGVLAGSHLLMASHLARKAELRCAMAVLWRARSPAYYFLIEFLRRGYRLRGDILKPKAER